MRRHDVNSGTALVIKDPLRGEFFRLQEAERFITEQLDGATSLELIHQRVQEKFGATLAPEALAGFMKALERNGLLEGPSSSAAQQHKQRRRRLGGNLAYVQFRLLDPDRLLSALVRRVQFFFTSQFLVASASLIVAAAAVSVLHGSEIIQDASRLYLLSTLPLLIAVVFAVITAHEFAHGLACKYFGGEVHEMGFLLIYFQPALYCNVSDAWLFPEKSKRLAVGFAGPYFELFLWALATLAWRFTDTETWISHVSLVVMLTSGIKTLFNFNPLIKFDGYYLLSDYLEIPNLRQKAFRYLGEFLKRFGGLARPLPAVSLRERRIYLGYGLLAWVFSVSLFAYVTLLVGQHLIVQNRRGAFLAFTGLVGLKLRNLFGRNRGNSETDSPRPSVSGKLPRFARLLLKLGVLAGGFLVLLIGRMELRVAGPVNVLPLHNADVRTQIEGIIDEIYVSEGQRVNKGDLIARLSDREHRAELQKNGAEIQQIQAKIAMLRAGPTKQQIEVARRAVATAEDRLQFAQTKLSREKSLFEEKLLAPSDFDTTRELESAAKNEFAENKSKLQVLLDGSRPEEIAAALAELTRLEAQRRYWTEQLQLVNVLSPAAGMITTPNRQLREMDRQMVQKGDIIAKVHELDTVTVEAAISENEIADVKIGQRVAVKVRAHPEHLFYGTVTEIAMTVRGAASLPKATPAASSLVPLPNAILVTTEIDNNAHLLKPGMTGMAKIYCGERRMIDLLKRRLSRTFRVEFWSWW